MSDRAMQRSMQAVCCISSIFISALLSSQIPSVSHVAFVWWAKFKLVSETAQPRGGAYYLRWLPSLIYNSVRTQNFLSPSLLTRINLCLRIASLDESNCVPDLPLCEVFGVPLSLSCSLSHGDS